MRDTIKKHSDFLTAPDDPSAVSEFFIIRAKKAKNPTNARYGLIATKKIFRFATERNRAKRLLRDWVAYCQDMMAPEYDYIFIARTPILNTSRTQGRTAMAKALQYIMQKHVYQYRKSLQKNS